MTAANLIASPALLGHDGALLPHTGKKAPNPWFALSGWSDA
jgi:hypothetical protein